MLLQFVSVQIWGLHANHWRAVGSRGRQPTSKIMFNLNSVQLLTSIINTSQTSKIASTTNFGVISCKRAEDVLNIISFGF